MQALIGLVLTMVAFVMFGFLLTRKGGRLILEGISFALLGFTVYALFLTGPIPNNDAANQRVLLYALGVGVMSLVFWQMASSANGSPVGGVKFRLPWERTVVETNRTVEPPPAAGP